MTTCTTGEALLAAPMADFRIVELFTTGFTPMRKVLLHKDHVARFKTATLQLHHEPGSTRTTAR